MPEKNISIIVAIAENYAIGKDNRLLYHLSDDLKRFKKLTTGHTVIMGRNTFLSLPAGALPNRTNIVISDVPGERFPCCIMTGSIEDAISKCDENDECFIIGGGMIYRQFLPYASRLYITWLHASPDADTFFPEINFDQWVELSRERHKAEGKNEVDYSFVIYKRKDP